MDDRSRRVAPVAAVREQQQRLRGTSRYCSLNRSTVDSLGLTAGDQVRIETSKQAAVYTIIEIHHGRHEIRMPSGGRRRLGINIGAPVAISNQVPAKQTPFEAAWRTGSFFETVWQPEHLKRTDTPVEVAVLAPHGGDIEPGSARTAAGIHANVATTEFPLATWLGCGFSPAARTRWHVSCFDLTPSAYPELCSLVDQKINCAIGIHANSGDHIVIGGGNQQFRHAILEQLRDVFSAVSIEDLRNRISDGTDQVLADRVTDARTNGVYLGVPQRLLGHRYGAVSKAIVRTIRTKYDLSDSKR